ncbi:hypothetical protein ACLI4U_09670 [Natrialbaceae archaeon A-CW2]
MGIVEQVLCDFETKSGYQYTIEYNDNGYIHLHTEHVRLDLTVEEFENLVKAVSEGKEELLEMKDGL